MRQFKIKICGVTNVKDAVIATELGADAIGLNFYEKSFRSVSSLDAVDIAMALPKEVTTIGVFVNHSADEIRGIAAHLRLTAVQLHGDETTEIVSRLNGLDIIRAIRVADPNAEGLAAIQSEIDDWCDAGVHGILVDKAAGKAYGGTGETFDWRILERLKIQVPTILAGGLNPDNVAEAISVARPDAVDVASGVEGFPGSKDPALLRRFITNARKA